MRILIPYTARKRLQLPIALLLMSQRRPEAPCGKIIVSNSAFICAGRSAFRKAVMFRGMRHFPPMFPYGTVPSWLV